MAPRDVRPSLNFVDSPALTDPQWYSHGVSIVGSGRTVLTSGQVGQRSDGSWPTSLGDQVKQAVVNLEQVLKAAGASPHDIIHLRFYVVDWDLALGTDLVGPVIALLTEKHGAANRPLTTLVPVPKLAFPEARFEIEAVANIGGTSRPWGIATDMIHKQPDPITTRHLTPSIEVDVVVVGGGFSGLMAAHELNQSGISVAVLEAKHRIGGRSRTERLKTNPDAVVELGATWINKTTQPTIYALTEKFHLETVEQYTDGDQIYQGYDGRVYRCGSDQVHNENTAAVLKLMQLLVVAAEECDIHDFESFAEEDDVSLTEWVAQRGLGDNPAVQASLHLLSSAVLGREPEDVGAHYFLDYLKSGCGYLSIVSEGELGAQSLKIKKGTSAVADALAATLPSGSVMLHSPVDRITQLGEKEIVVTTSSGSSYKAKKVIMANPTNTYSNIQFTPPLPPAKRALVTRTLPGVYAKAVLTYSSPWWREVGLVGKFESVIGPICFSWDISDLSTKQYSLALFVAGNPATMWHALNELEREEAIIEHLVTLVGEHSSLAQKARDVQEYNYMEWTKEEYIGGAPTCALGPGMLKKYGKALRDSFGDIHFGGGETSYEWKGYLEGALLAGQRAANEVIASLDIGAKTNGIEAGESRC
ncbi:putative flavin-containing monoamine oxidase A-like protein [Cladobotryum mycophilum]|uniref:Amine oxidase n=1 Tax=Cladobotryum mycophilum TaxID=491253 RepID=A0ABR0SBC4_9HYPO